MKGCDNDCGRMTLNKKFCNVCKNKVYFKVKYHERHLANRLGARWDKKVRHWYTRGDYHENQMSYHFKKVKIKKIKKKPNKCLFVDE